MHYRTKCFIVVLSALMQIMPLSSCINRPSGHDKNVESDLCSAIRDSIKFISGNHDVLLSFNVSIADTCNISLAMDTGSPDLTLDKSLCQRIFNIDSLHENCLCTTEKIEFSYDASSSYEECIYSPVSLAIFGDTIKYERFFVSEGFKDEFGVDGLFSIPANYEKKIVFNFTGGYIEITDGCSTSNYDFSVDVENERYFYVLKNFPFSFGEKGTSYSDLILDTGTGSKTVSVLGQCDFDCAITGQPAIFKDIDAQFYYYLIPETGVLNDTISVYVNRLSGSFDKPLVGLDFLIRFDVCWDVPNHKMWFKRNLNEDSNAYFQQHGAVINHIRMITNTDYTSAMVLRLGLGDNAYIAGIRPFDILTKVGGRALDSTFPYYRMYCRDNGLPCDFEILRNGKILTFNFLP